MVGLSKLELSRIYVIFLDAGSAIYLYERLMSGSFDIGNTYGSPSFVCWYIGCLFSFNIFIITDIWNEETYRNIILQQTQIALLLAQKFQIDSKLVTL